VKNKKGQRVDAGNYYERQHRDGWLVPTAPAVPDVIVCRRVVDYAPAPVPDGAAVETCSQCSALVAYNPAGPAGPGGPFQRVPKVCMQCARIKPLPMDA